MNTLDNAQPSLENSETSEHPAQPVTETEQSAQPTTEIEQSTLLVTETKQSAQPVTKTEPPRQLPTAKTGRHSGMLFLLVAFALGLGSGYLLWGLAPTNTATNTAIASSELAPKPAPAPTSAPTSEPTSEPVAQVSQVSLPNDYTLPTSFGDIGPQLLAAGAIDYDSFVQVYEQAEQPLTEEQLAILSEGSDEPIVINRENAYFLLNFFWAVGLTNKNALLEEGPMMQYGREGVGRFASTGGWTIGAKPITELYASAPMIALTPEQQARVEEVAQGVYRPCCNNPTSFPDCNHGMAMLGLLQLMASQGATVDEMFTAAQYVNAFWFPQQSLEIALYFKHTQDLNFDEVDPRQFVGGNFSSSAGFQGVHQWLATNGKLEQIPNRGNSCGV